MATREINTDLSVNAEEFIELIDNGSPLGQFERACSPGCIGHRTHPCEKCGQQWRSH